MRDATIDDAQGILDIMDYYMKNTAVHFSCTAPETEEFKKTMNRIIGRYPFFVLEEEGGIKGFAYAKHFSDVPAYDWSCELTIYIKEDSKGKGLGKKLYNAIENVLKRMGIKNLYAYIAYIEGEDEYLDNTSMKFHEKMGFETTAKFSKCGYKFERWYDVIWMEKIISSHETHPEKITSYKDIGD